MHGHGKNIRQTFPVSPNRPRGSSESFMNHLEVEATMFQQTMPSDLDIGAVDFDEQALTTKRPHQPCIALSKSIARPQSDTNVSAFTNRSSMFSRNKNKGRAQQRPQGQSDEPTFAGPSSRPANAREVARANRESSLNKETDRLIGGCTDWRRRQQEYVPRKANEFKMQKLRADQEELVAKARLVARMITHDRGYLQGQELIGRVKQELVVPGERPSAQLTQLLETWQAPGDTAQERLSQLKIFRYKLSLAELVHQFINVDDLDLRNELVLAIARLDELQKSPVVEAHKERTRKLEVGVSWDVLPQAESDFYSVSNVLDSSVEHGGNEKDLRSQEKQCLAQALRREARPGSPQGELATKGKVYEAGLLLATKALMVVKAATLLGLPTVARAAEAKLNSFIGRQPVIRRTTIEGLADGLVARLSTAYTSGDFGPFTALME